MVVPALNAGSGPAQPSVPLPTPPDAVQLALWSEACQASRNVWPAATMLDEAVMVTVSPEPPLLLPDELPPLLLLDELPLALPLSAEQPASAKPAHISNALAPRESAPNPILPSMTKTLPVPDLSSAQPAHYFSSTWNSTRRLRSRSAAVRSGLISGRLLP